MNRFSHRLPCLLAILLLALGTVSAAGETLEITAAECAGMSGFRAHWDRTIPVAEEGERVQRDAVVKDRGQTAVWGG